MYPFNKLTLGLSRGLEVKIDTNLEDESYEASNESYDINHHTVQQ